MAIQVSEKKKESTLPKGVDMLFRFAIVFFILVSLSYFFMMYLNAEAVETKTEIESAIETKKAEIPEKEELEKKIRDYFNLIEDFKLIVKNHRVMSPFFEPFEKMIHPEVSLSEMRLDLSGNTGTFAGKGEDLVAVGQQFHVLKNREFISDVELTGLTVSEDDEVVFSFLIKLNADFFKFQLTEND